VVILLFASEQSEPAQGLFEPTKSFQKKSKPKRGDWLARFKERSVTFKNYCASDPVRPRPGDVLRFVPVGKFSEKDRALLKKTAEFAAIWFTLPVETTKDQKLPVKGWQREHMGSLQFRTAWFLDHLLPPFRKDNVVCVSGITMEDLYPEDGWNFVFGQASLRSRVGVWSFARLTGGDDTQDLRRCCKIVVHEIGHMFGLEHCIRYECNMNGSNHLEETDRQPLHLCPDCLRKSAWNQKFDVVARYRKLGKFYAANGLKTEAAWIARRLAELKTVPAAGAPD